MRQSVFRAQKWSVFGSRGLLQETAIWHHIYFVFQVQQMMETSVSRVFRMVQWSIAYLYEIVCFQGPKMVCFGQQRPTARDSNLAPHLFCIPGVVDDRDIGIKSFQHCVLLDCVSVSDSLFLVPKNGLFWQQASTTRDSSFCTTFILYSRRCR